FLLHELALEDVMHMQQRAKVEPYNDHLFVVLRAVGLDNGTLESEQLSLFLGKGFVISFEQNEPGLPGIKSLQDRLRKGSGHLRSESADYLLYAAIDSVIDGFFPVLEATSDALEVLEDEIVDQKGTRAPALVHELKRNLLTLRRAIWPA